MLKSSLVGSMLVRSILAIAILLVTVPAIAAVATTTVVTVVEPQGSGNTTPTATSVYGQPVAVTVAVTAGSGMAAPDGSVSVTDGSGLFYCTATLGSPVGLTATGTCNLPMPITATGGVPQPYRIVASYTGTATFAASISSGAGNGSLTVNAATTVTTITAHTPNPSVVNSPIAVTATVVVMPPGVGTPDPDKIAVDDGAVTCYLLGGSCNLTPITPGVKTLSARYNGDNNFTTSFSPGVSHTVTGGGATPTATIVKALTPQGSGNTTPTATSVYGQPVAVTVAVTAGSGMAAPDGSVSVTDGSGLFYCTATLGSPVGLTATGTCNLPMPITATGGVPQPYRIVASYTGTATFAASISSGAGNGSLTVNAATTVTTITAHTPNPSVVNSPIAVTATVVVMPPGVGTPDPDKIAVDDGAVTCYLLGGSCNLTPITPGVKTLSARYNGDNNFTTSFSPGVSHTVTGGGATPTATIVKALTPQGSGNTTPTATSVYGQPVAVTVAVTAGSGMAAPDGSVSVTDGSGLFYCTATLGSPVGLTATGTCNLPMPITATGGVPQPYRIVASYTGTATFAASISSGAGNGSLTVNAATTVTTITAHTPNPSVVNSPIAVTATVVVMPPGVGTPDPDKIAVDDGAVTCYLLGGSCNLTPITPGVKTLSARYNGDNNFTTSFSPGVSHTVTGGGSTFTGPTVAPGVNGTVTLNGGGPSCVLVNPAFIAVSPLVPPPGTSFPFGLFDFSTTGCTIGGTITVQIVYSQSLPAGTQYWKFGPTPGGGANSIPHWYVMPGSTVSGTTVTFSIQDGQIGDDDLVANGVIVDQGGPGVSLPASSAAIPTIDGYALVLLALMMVVVAGMTLRQKRLR